MLYNINLTDVNEPQIMPRGVYSLRIANAEANQENGKNNIRCYIEFVDHLDTAQVMSHWCGLPLPTDSPEKVKTKMLMTRRFLELFKIPYGPDGFDIQDFFGATATTMVEVEPMTDKDGTPTGRNANRLNPPNLSSEQAPVSKAPRKR